MNSFVKNLLSKKISGYVHDDIKDVSKYKLFYMGESFIAPSKKIKQLLKQYDIKKLSAYLDPKYKELREAIAKNLNIKPEFIMTTSGADEAISLIPRALAEPGEASAIVVPTFYRITESNVAFKINNIVIAPDDKKNYEYDTTFINKIIREVNQNKVRLIWICNPNNPMGNIISEDKIEKILKAIHKNSILIIDEVFFEFYDPTNKKSAVRLVKKYKNLIVVRSLSKSYGLAGIRVGYAVSSKEIIEAINNIKPVFNINALSEDVVKVALNDDGYIQEVSQKTKIEREFLFGGIKKLANLSIVGDSQTNVFLLSHKQKDIFEELKKHKILTADFRNSIGLEGQGCVRVTIQDRKMNEELLKILKKIN